MSEHQPSLDTNPHELDGESPRTQEMHRNLNRMRLAPYVLGLVQFGGLTREQAERHVDNMDPKDRDAMIKHATPDYPW